MSTLTSPGDQKVYDDEFDKIAKRNPDLAKLGKQESEAVKPSSDNSTPTVDKLQNAEHNPLAPKSNAASKGFYKGVDDLKKHKLKINRKKVVGGGIVGALLTGGITILAILQGPAQIVHLSNFLSSSYFDRNNNASNSRMREWLNRFSDKREYNNLGWLGQQVAERQRAKLEAQGIKMLFDNPDGKNRRTLQAFDIDTRTDGGKALIAALRAEGVTIHVDPDTDRVVIPMRGLRGIRTARAVSGTLGLLSGYRGLIGKLNSRMLRALMGVKFSIPNVVRRAGESAVDHQRRLRDERAIQTSQGADGLPLPDGADDAVKEEVQKAKEAKGAEAKKAATKSAASRILRIGPAGILGVVCGFRDVGNQIPNYKMLNVIIPLVRTAMFFISAGSQVQYGGKNVSLEQVQSVTEPLYDPEDKTSVFDAEPLRAAAGLEGGVPIDPEVRTQIVGAYNGDKPGVFTVIDNIPALGFGCWVTELSCSIPLVDLACDAMGELANEFAGIVSGKTLEEWMEILVAMVSGGAIDTSARGAALGNLLAYGSLLASNSTALSSGGIPMTQAQALEWKEYNNQIAMIERSQRSLSERLFDLSSADSLASTLVFRVSMHANSQAPHKLLSGVLATITSGFTNSLGNMFGRLAFAAPLPYSYGIPEFGIPMDVLENPSYADPLANTDFFEDNNFAGLRQANTVFGRCFSPSGKPLLDEGPTAGRINIEQSTGDFYKDLPNCAQYYNNPAFQRYQIYILDNITIKSMACYEGISEDACTELGLLPGSSQAVADESGEENTQANPPPDSPQNPSQEETQP